MATRKRARFYVDVASDDTRASELRQLRKMVDRVPEGSYLGMLFTDGLYNWAERRMTEDWSLDVHGEMEYWQDKATSAEAQAKQMESSHKTFRRVRDQELATAKADVAELLEKLEAERERATEAERMYRVETYDHADTFSRLTMKKHRLHRALARFRKIAADRESKWVFVLKQLTERV